MPVRHFVEKDKGGTSGQPLDPDGNPDTSFLAKIPANVAWTFQTLDKNGMVLNMAQTWHQLRPGEVRNDCGGCHAHSQKPTPFELTAAAKADYKIFDLTTQTPLMTTKKLDQSGKKWDSKDETGLRYEPTAKTVEFFKDVKPIFDRSCVACHSQKLDKPAAGLVLDDERWVSTQNPAGLGFGITVSGTYARLAADTKGEYGIKPLRKHGWNDLSASRYIKLMQARRSLLIWKIYGQRLDGWNNEDLPYETIPGDPSSLSQHGKPVPDTPKNRELSHIGFTGGAMPPPEAVKSGKIQALTDEDRLTLVRWIDLGCPIDLSKDSARPGWSLDDQRPTLTLTYPRAGSNDSVTRILVGMHDYGTGLDMKTFHVSADFAVNGVEAGKNLADQFRVKSQGVRELVLERPMAKLSSGSLTVSVKDRQGNESRIERTFSVK
jgi:hypothetical protein